METMTAWILGVLLMLGPPEKVKQKNETVQDVQARYELTATNMATVIHSRGPLFKGKDGDYKTAALMLAITKFESELGRDVAVGEKLGDHGKSFCYMQINVDGKNVIWGDATMKSWTGADLTADWTKCFATGHEVLRVSLMGCAGAMSGGDLLSMYTSGKCQTGEKKAHHRWNLAQWILRKSPAPSAAITRAD